MLTLFSFVVAAESDYRLDSGDTISISVFGEQELSTQVLINTRGVINYPFLGEVKVSGLTLAELEKKIEQGLQPDYLINPDVAVAINTYRPFFIEGEVKKAGAYPYQPGLTIAKAVVLAGGFTERASKDKIFIVKAADDTAQSGNAKLNDKVQPGDIISVKQSFF
ncbi:polysaccharide biosynthesis/export family protein [Thalassotalea sp. ND16A]|uniref:polysaccharide biosynthesis/export family protein n=1 Tax=Thalassotalea sp. ND16A TaxID=1535422 RepID=UPI00068EEFA8|nr:polysaccharide biosynthesis/export family protein [Thalassotalea sp. ND16A]